MDELPEPLTPADCDLRGMDWMPLHGHKLYGSDFDAIASDTEFRAAQRLWWAAWQQQVPAASMPDDDRVLAHAAGFARDPKGWSKIKSVAMHAFVKCSDGRLYHRFLAPEAIIAWDKRVKERDRKAIYRANRGGTKVGNKEDVPTAVPRDNDGTGQTQEADVPIPSHVDSDSDRDKERKKDSEAIASAPLDPRTRLFREGLAIVGHMTGKPPDKCRALLGRMLKDLDDDCTVAFSVIQDAAENRPADPVAWIVAAVSARKKPRLTALQRAAIKHGLMPEPSATVDVKPEFMRLQ